MVAKGMSGKMHNQHLQLAVGYITHLQCTSLTQLYSNLPEEFMKRLSSDTHGCFDTQGRSTTVKADQSFKLASEVALMIVFLFQCYPRLLQDNAEKLLPLMVKVGRWICEQSGWKYL